MLASERMERIVETVNGRGIAKTADLARELGVTEPTIRRDCEELERQGRIIRVHGGAKRVSQSPIVSHGDEKRMVDRVERLHEKEAVCRKAASYVRHGDCVFLDGGTTIVPMLRYLAGKGVNIVTHSELVAEAFDDPTSELFLVGGRFIPEYRMSAGPLAVKMLSHFNFDHAFLSCAGFDLEKGFFYAAETETMAVKEKAMELAEKKCMLIDESKLSVRGFYSFSAADRFDAIICNGTAGRSDEELPENFVIADEGEGE